MHLFRRIPGKSIRIKRHYISKRILLYIHAGKELWDWHEHVSFKPLSQWWNMHQLTQYIWVHLCPWIQWLPLQRNISNFRTINYRNSSRTRFVQCACLLWSIIIITVVKLLSCFTADGRSSNFLSGIVVYVGSGLAALAFIIIVVIVLSVAVVTVSCVVRKKRIKVNGVYLSYLVPGPMSVLVYYNISNSNIRQPSWPIHDAAYFYLVPLQMILRITPSQTGQLTTQSMVWGRTMYWTKRHLISVSAWDRNNNR